MQADQLPIIIGLFGLFSNLIYCFLKNLDMILDDMIANKSLLPEKRLVTRNSLLLKHIHQVCLF